MKVLITGGYGFIGSHVAERFYREGHEIFILDDLSTGNRKNVEIEHKFYLVDVTSKDCEKFFKNHLFDVVVHLAAQINVAASLENPYLDVKSNLLGLVNMLSLSVKYGVKKFIFASSAAVYGNSENIPLCEAEPCDPVSPYGMSKYTGEFYCRKWSEIYGLNTVCFRFSNVYGPRQGTNGEGGVISNYLEKLAKGRDLTVFGDGAQTRDFIYVEDVAEAIYRSVQADCHGVFNLSTNVQESINEIINILQGFHPIKRIVYQEQRTGDIRHSCLDNNKLRNELGWVPAFTLETGLEKTCRWYFTYYV